MKKLSRKEINEGLEQIPINQILLGSGKAGITLTKKQKAFAEEVVKTGNKTKAYKKAYNHTGKQTTAQRNAQAIVSNSKVSTYITALEAAKEAETYLLPARLRTLAIHRLTGLALNDEIAPAQQLKALELIGKMTEVALFTERRELVKVTDSADMRDQLMKSLRLAISSGGAIDVEANEIDSLLSDISGRPAVDDAEPDHESLLYDADEPDQLDQSADTLPIEGGEAFESDILGNPPPPTRQKTSTIAPALLHSIPLNKSNSESNPTLTPVNVYNPLKSDTYVSSGVNPNKDKPPIKPSLDMGEGVIKIRNSVQEESEETPPVNDLNENGVG